MKRCQQNVETRPEAARRRKPWSKIEARLRQRRDKLDNIGKTSSFSPGITMKKRDSERSSRSSVTSSSDSEISPRFMTSKQHVELVNFETRKFLPAPRFRKLTENRVEKIEATPVRGTLDESRETNKNPCQTIVKKKENEKNPMKNTKTLPREEIFDSKIEKRNPRNESFYGNPSKIIDPKIVEDDDDALKKRRSRSAPCNPLFKIKCAKDKCPRNFLVERKSLLCEKKITAEIRESKKNCIRGLRISRSGEVAVTSVREPQVRDRIVERATFESRREEFQTILAPKNLQEIKLHQEEIDPSVGQKNTKLQHENTVTYSNVESVHPGNTQSFQREDIETSSNPIGKQSLQQQSIESSPNLANRQLIQTGDIEESSKPMQGQPLEQKDVESVFLQENTESHQDEDTESSWHSKNQDSLRKEDIDSCPNPRNMQSLQQTNGESYTLEDNINLLQNAESSSDPKNMLNLQKTTESSSNLKNSESLQQENVESSANPKNPKSLQQVDIGSIFRPEVDAVTESKEEKIKSQVSLFSGDLNSKEEVSTVRTVDKVQVEADFVSRERGKEDISRVAESPERRNGLQKRGSPRKPPKKRAFKWETILEKQHQQSASRSPENRKESSDAPTKIPEDNKFDFWAAKDASCSKHCRCPKSRLKSLEERKLAAYSAIREELPKILMKRRLIDPTTNPEIRIEASKTGNRQENLRDSSNQHSSPERSVNRNDSRLSQRFVDNFSKRWARRDYSMPAHFSKLPDSPFSQKISKNIEDSARRDSEIHERIVEDSGFRCDSSLNQRQNLPKNNKITSDPTLSPRNFERSVGTKKAFGTTVLRRRKSPSPRRVTFRLPGRVIEENCEDEDSSLQGSNCGKLISEECTCDSDNEANDQAGWSEKNCHSEKKTEVNYNIDQERSSLVEDEFRRHSGISNSCVEEKSRKLRSSNTLSGKRNHCSENIKIQFFF